jgi:hypothetical protein
VVSSFVPVLNKWTHIAITFNGNVDARLYVNGVEDLSSPWGMVGIDNIKGGVDKYFLGGEPTSTGSMSNIKLDEFAIFDDELTATEIKKIYQEQSQLSSELSASWTPKHTDLIGHWKMDSEKCSLCYDICSLFILIF